MGGETVGGPAGRSQALALLVAKYLLSEGQEEKRGRSGATTRAELAFAQTQGTETLAEQLGNTRLFVTIGYRPCEKQVAPDADADQTLHNLAQGNGRSRPKALKVFVFEGLATWGAG